jgi:ABC-type multidrug transport system permease subunit
MKESSENQFLYMLLAIVIASFLGGLDFYYIKLGWAILWLLLGLPTYCLGALAIFCLFFDKSIPEKEE